MRAQGPKTRDSSARCTVLSHDANICHFLQLLVCRILVFVRIRVTWRRLTGTHWTDVDSGMKKVRLVPFPSWIP
jgi:hypothetical protein